MPQARAPAPSASHVPAPAEPRRLPRPLAYDLTRLWLRYSGATPNGIDRIDINLARHVFAGEAHRGVILTGLRPGVMSPRSARAVLAGAEAHWREDGATAGAAAALQAHGAARSHRRRPGAVARAQPLVSAAAILARHVRPAPIPRGAIFLHATQFPLVGGFRWLERRPDVTSVFFVHDLLPVRHPEFFAAGGGAWHRRALDVAVRFGDAFIVNSHAVANDLADYLGQRGRCSPRILANGMPADPAFAREAAFDPELAAQPYFVACGTIEPRKNHLLLLQVWRRLARVMGAKTPKLVLIGKRGWENENVLDLLERSDEISPHVIELSGWATPAVHHLVAHARAVLVPSFAEGYGLPVLEALAAGTPVIAADIPVFREIRENGVSFCSALDGCAWLEAIVAQCERAPMLRPGGSAMRNRQDWLAYFGRLDAFLARL